LRCWPHSGRMTLAGAFKARTDLCNAEAQQLFRTILPRHHAEQEIHLVQMKKLLLFSIPIIAIALIGCCIWILWPKFSKDTIGHKSPTLQKSIDYLPLSHVRRSRNVTIAQLQNPTQIDGFSCAAGWIHFSESGHLQAFYLAENSTIQDNQLPKGTWIRLRADQTLQLCFFPKETIIQGYMCDGGRGGSEGVTTSFYPGGRLESFYTPKDAVIHGIPCQAGPFQPIYLYENGNLKQFTLSQDSIISGRNLSEGQTIVLNDHGEVQSAASLSIFERTGSWFTRLFR
jgi:hypothetical protein